ncbi:unnamed protein product, partial [Amoebophrya sp. A25]
FAPFGGPVGKSIDVLALKDYFPKDFCKEHEDIGFTIDAQDIRAELYQKELSAKQDERKPYKLSCTPKDDSSGDWRVTVPG